MNASTVASTVTLSIPVFFVISFTISALVIFFLKKYYYYSFLIFGLQIYSFLAALKNIFWTFFEKVKALGFVRLKTVFLFF